MAHQKINYVLILFFTVLLLAGCKKESKEYTTVIWEVVNPVTNAPYTNIKVRLYEAKKTNNGIEYSLIYEGKTNNQGRVEYSFKANLSGKYWYRPEINEGSLGVNGIDYSVIKQPSPSVDNVKKDEENIIRYEIVPYGEYVTHIKNINCQGTNDQMRLRRRYKVTGFSADFDDWTPYNEGCFENIYGVYKRRSDSVFFEIEVIRGSSTEIIQKEFFIGPNEIDTLKLYY
jgi:hypothetical protein